MCLTISDLGGFAKTVKKNYFTWQEIIWHRTSHKTTYLLFFSSFIELIKQNIFNVFGIDLSEVLAGVLLPLKTAKLDVFPSF